MVIRGPVQCTPNVHGAAANGMRSPRRPRVGFALPHPLILSGSSETFQPMGLFLFPADDFAEDQLVYAEISWELLA